MHKIGWQIKALLICLMDMLLVSAAYFLSLWVRFDLQFSRIDRVYLTGYEHLIPVYVVLVVVVFGVSACIIRFGNLPRSVRCTD